MTTPVASTSSNVQKKLLSYARDVALDKLNKKLDKKIAKQQIRKHEHESELYQRYSRNSDFAISSSQCATSSSVPSSVRSSDPSTSTIYSENSLNPRYSLNRNDVGMGRTSSESSCEDDDYQTADEEDEPLYKKEVLMVCDQLQWLITAL